MQNITSFEIKKIEANLEKIGDFIYYEGPLLSLYQDKINDGNYYFYKWADCDDECNRWLIFLVTEENLKRFLFEELSLRQLITKNQFMYLVDLDNDFEQKKCLVVEMKDLPSNYLPSEDSFYGEEDYTKFAQYYKSNIANRKSSVLNLTTLNFILKEIRNFETKQEVLANQVNKIFALLSDKNATKVV